MAVNNSLTDRTIVLVSTLDVESQQYYVERVKKILSNNATYHEMVFYLYEFNKLSDLEAYLDSKLSNTSDCEESNLSKELKSLLLGVEDPHKQSNLCFSLIAGIEDEEGWDNVIQRAAKQEGGQTGTAETPGERETP